jgi:hypothetical protein
MKGGHIHLIDLDFEYKLWKTRLELFVREVDILRVRNVEIENRPAKDRLNVVELMVLDDHQAQIEKFLNRIVTQEQELQYYNKDFPINRTHQFFADHLVLRRKMAEITRVHYEKMDDIIKELGVDSV